MDKHGSQSGGPHPVGAHEGSDINARVIIWFGVILAVGGVLAFVASGLFLVGLEKLEKRWEVKLTPMEQQMQKARTSAPEAEAKAGEEKTGEKKEEAGAVPEWYGGGNAENRLSKTFPTPRLQYDDTADMDLFRGEEDAWLQSTGKDAKGDIHIPVTRAMEILLQRGLPPVDGTFVSNPPVPVAGAVNVATAAATKPAPAKNKKSGATGR